MNNKNVLDSIGYVDADLICEAEDNSPVIKRKNAVRWISVAACLCIAVAVAVILGSKGNISTLKKTVASEKAEANDNIAIEDNPTDEAVPDLLMTETDGSVEKAEDNTVKSGTSDSSTNAVPAVNAAPAEKSSDNKSTDKSATEMNKGVGAESTGDGYSCGGPFIPAVPKSKIKVNGEKLTDAEGAKYLEENKGSLVSSLSQSGVTADNIKICEKGYGHVSYDGSTMDYLNYNQNFRDYLVYNGNDIIAIVTLWKENGKIYSSPAFGAPWFKNYASFLRAHKGQSLLYVYAGYAEIIITPDGKAYNPQGLDVSVYLEGIDNPYNYFYSEGAVYTP